MCSKCPDDVVNSLVIFKVLTIKAEGLKTDWSFSKRDLPLSQGPESCFHIVLVRQ